MLTQRDQVIESQKIHFLTPEEILMQVRATVRI